MNEIDNEAYWQSPETVSKRLDQRLREDKPFVVLDGPSRVDTEIHADIPVLVAQAGAARDFVAGSLAVEGWLAMVDEDRNWIALRPVQYSPGADPVDPGEPMEVDLDDPSVGMQEEWVDLREMFDPGFFDGAHRWAVRGVLDRGMTNTVRMEVGPGGERFVETWEKSRSEVPVRDRVPDSFLASEHPWKAMSVTAELARGMDVKADRRQDGHHLEVAIACEPLWGERLETEPGAVLPNGMRPPDAMRMIHLVVMSGSRVRSRSLDVPAIAGFQDGLLRCRMEISLPAVFPDLVLDSLWGCYVFCGPLAAGPLRMG
ncbi:MAG: hypothetical protein IPK50_06825 [Fibrobacterota bacterium]|nr:hypothetical protein [Fibrobacterota bacterium]QQS06606.1 MAG: hypothetical protein IPK50_06825 [Fibrobacterota bacterium]